MINGTLPESIIKHASKDVIRYVLTDGTTPSGPIFARKLCGGANAGGIIFPRGCDDNIYMRGYVRGLMSVLVLRGML